jgi:hypothetical protein
MRIRGTKGNLSRAFSCALVLTAVGCGGGPALRAAEQGDLEAVRRTLTRGGIDANEARDIARAVLRREVRGASGDAGISRLRELPMCAKALDEALEERSARRDAVGATATIVRFEAGLVDREELAETARTALAVAGGASSSWRAAAARGLVGKADGQERRKLIADPDQEVRLAALRASMTAADPADLEALLEAARVDPNPSARALAIDATSNIGGARVVLALKDLFAQAGEDERLSIVGAWASPRAFAAGGRTQLVRTAETGSGPATIAAAAVLMRLSDDPASSSAAGVVARAIATGSTRERVFAIAAASLEAKATRDAVIGAQKDTDEDVALAALSKSLDLYPAEGDDAKPAERAKVVARLMVMAKGNSLRAVLAKATLARAGAREVLPLLEQDARSGTDQARKAAGTSLVALGEVARAAWLAADPDVRVRTGVACAMLRPSP